MKNNSILQNEQIIRYCLECDLEIKQFFLPLYNYENKTCERCKVDDYKGKCHCNE